MLSLIHFIATLNPVSSNNLMATPVLGMKAVSDNRPIGVDKVDAKRLGNDCRL